MIIYKIHFPNDKIYIGKTTKSVKERKSQHYRKVRYGSRTKIHNALRKYKNLEKWSIIDTAINENDLNLKEIDYIKKFASNKKGYNLTVGGEGTSGYKKTPEQIENSRKTCIGRIPWNKGKSGVIKDSESTKRKKFISAKKSKEKLDIFKEFEVYKVKQLQRASKGKPAKYAILNKVGRFKNQHDCAKLLGVSVSNLNNVLKGNKKQTKGYYFSYVQ